MRLRTRIITTVAAIMLLSLLILTLAILKLSLDYDRMRRDEIKELIRAEMPFLFRNMDESEFIKHLNLNPVLSEWRVSRGNKVVAESRSDGSIAVNTMYTSVSLDNGSPPAILHFIIRGRSIIQQSHFTFFVTWLICVFLMAGILYLTVSRLIIKPIDIMIEASRQASRGQKPGMNPISGRTDEAGLMVREFYSLLAEIHEYRTQLEEKVKEASREIQKTHEKLIISQRLSATGKLAAGIAHEINNPLGGMLNAVATLKKHITSEKDKEYFDLVEECIRRIERLVKELLTFVRIEKEFTEVNLAESIDFACRMVRHYLEDKEITFTAETAKECIIKGNPGQIQQMLLNLFLNSIHSIPGKGTGRITVKTGQDPQKGVILTVEDNGCGIPKDEQDSVFDLFYTSREGNEGTGLGLSIVHSIVTNHKGSIHIVSNEGEGTAVTVTFPNMERNS
ncbi:sensor histidine kinase [Planctomycetota bacterium]